MNTTNIKFLQTGGVPLTNDLMDTLQKGYAIYNALASVCGHLTILEGAVVTGNTVSPGIVAVNGEVFYFEGGTASTNTFVNKDETLKTFQDTSYKVLIEVRTIRFGNGDPATTYPWSDFVRLKTIGEISELIADMATTQQIANLQEQIDLLKLKTAPVVNGGVVWAWFKPASDIPAGWKECVDVRGRTIVGLQPGDAEFGMLKGTYGTKKHQLTVAELPSHRHSFQTTRDFGDSTPSSQVTTDPQQNKGPGYTDNTGSDQPHNNIQPSIIAYYIEPNLP